MQNFARLGTTELHLPILETLKAHGDTLWMAPGAHPYEDVKAPANICQHICLRAGHPSAPGRMIAYPAWWVFPEAVQIARDLMHNLGAEYLGMVHISRLAPGGVIDEHEDHCGDYSENPRNFRYHIPLQADDGCLFHCAGETVNMRPGEIWTFAHRRPHSVEVLGPSERLHLMIDLTLLPRTHFDAI